MHSYTSMKIHAKLKVHDSAPKDWTRRFRPKGGAL